MKEDLNHLLLQELRPNDNFLPPIAVVDAMVDELSTNATGDIKDQDEGQVLSQPAPKENRRDDGPPAQGVDNCSNQNEAGPIQLSCEPNTTTRDNGLSCSRMPVEENSISTHLVEESLQPSLPIIERDRAEKASTNETMDLSKV